MSPRLSAQSEAAIARRRRVARAAYRAIARLGPGEVRAGFGAAMAETFDDLADAAASRGWRAVAALLAREAIDAVRARRHARRATPGPHERNTMRSLACDALSPRAWQQSARRLRRRPAFSLIAIVTLTLGTAMTTTAFAIVKTVLLAPLPFPAADRLVTVYEASPSTTERTSLVAPARLADWNQRTAAFDLLSGSYSDSVTDTSGPWPERLDARRVMPRYFDVFGMAPLTGRTFLPDEDRFGGPGAVVLSDAYWARRFGRDPHAIGRALVIGGHSFTIVGVMPRAFTSAGVDVWLPALTPPFIQTMRDARFVGGVGRMKAGVTIARATGDLARVQQALGELYPKTDAGWSVVLDDLKDANVGVHRSSIWLLFAAVSVLWAIGIANIAGLVLVEVRRRRRELAVRAALGAPRHRLVLTVARDFALLAAAGGACGLALAFWSIRLIPTFLPTLPRLNELTLDVRTMVFAAASLAIAGALCGVLPVLHATTRRLSGALASGGRGSTAGSHRLQQALVTSQVALSLLLVGSAALLARSYADLVSAPAGFSTDRTLTFHVAASWNEDRDRLGALQQHLIESLARLPGVEAAGLTNFLPMSAATLRYQVTVTGLAGTDAGGTMTAGERTVTSGYLQALQVPLVAGAWCPAFVHDFKQPQVVLVNQQFVRRFANGANLVGRDLRFAQSPQIPQTIAGVVGDVAEDGPGAAPVPYVYSCALAGGWPDANYIVRTAGDPTAIVATVRGLVRELDPSRAMFGAAPLERVLDGSMDEPRTQTGVIGALAATALLLAAIGLYGLFTLIVAEGRREIGVRLALGAAPASAARLVVARAARLVAIGLAIGAVLSVIAGRSMHALLYGARSLDQGTIAIAAAALAIVSAAAIVVPAVRASRVDATEALRDTGA